ncbi:MAG: N-6 DNA methylase [Flavobacterium nitrogenifigens]|uniref:Eco57I restriction-modification methylase domain-containing protein n=1 Tax=Flavobacterium nitrogenifigens TaxID=1617283 RepID=UPI002807FB3A|nr:N-6 DNA methylase [Flavobacterium nitrogenifigens]MDQ8015169.1 N-6 DNA methylase [Flavobacterium nitrogenifigens]
MLLEIFDWDVRDTSQILQEKILSKEEQKRIKEINSHNTRPDYTFRVAKQKLSFLDAKDVTVNLENDADAAFQIKSYGWSVQAPCAFISNFEEFAIYDCTYIPEVGQSPTLGRIYFKLDDLVENFEILELHLLKQNIYNGRLNDLYASTMQGNRYIQRVTPDQKFADQLSTFRLALATDILQNNRAVIGGNTANLSYIVQIIINRILFIRVCEARMIETEGLLQQFQEQGFWDAFKQSSYFDFFEHYDGPLFNRISSIHEIDISNEVFNGLLQQLYYPSPYRFDVIPTKLLSDIYEIFLAKKLVIVEDEVIDEIKSEYLKTKGAVSTPQYIVQEIIKRTIPRNQIIDKGITNFLNTKILDIACGSGVFAIEAYDYLEEIFVYLFDIDRNPDFRQYFFITETEVMLNLNGRKAIMDHCIFGVDIDAEAVEVAKVSLSFKIIDTVEYIDSYHQIGVFGQRILNGIGDNIKCGNSLVESDIIELYPGINDFEEEIIQTNIFDWSSDQGFESIFQEKGGFDYIIGNPPYVEVKNYNVDLPFMHGYIKDRYPSSKNGKVDLAIPFVERAIELLNPTGRMGFIIQKRFFKTDYGKKIREIITSQSYLSEIVDFEATTIFKGRMTYVALLILDKSAPENFAYKKIVGNVEFLAAQLRQLETPEIDPNSYALLPSSAVTGTPWSFEDNLLIEIRTKLLKKGSFGQYAKVKVGIQVLWDRAYHLRPINIQDGILTCSSHLEQNIELEIQACRPLICNENFYSYRKDSADVYVLFPYDVVDGNVTEILFDEFRDRFPLAADYLNRHRNAIEKAVETLPKKFPEKYTNEHWHLYTRVQNHGATYPKIIVPMTALDTFATFSSSNEVYCDNANVFFIQSPLDDELTILALSAIINSTVYSVLTRSVAMPQSNGYFKFNKQFLEPTPFPCENFAQNEPIKIKLASVVKKIQNQQLKYQQGSPNQKRIYARLLNGSWQELDDLCYLLYELEPEEIQFFQDKGRNVNRIDSLN